MNLPLILLIEILVFILILLILILGFIIYKRNYILTISIKTMLLIRIFLLLLMNSPNYSGILSETYLIYIMCAVVIILLLLLSIYADNRYLGIIFCFKSIWVVLFSILFIFLSFKVFDLTYKGVDIPFDEIEDGYLTY